MRGALPGPATGYHPDISELETGTARDFQQMFETIRRRWWLVAMTAAVAVVAAWFNGRNEIRRYTAEALLQQRESAPLVGLSFTTTTSEFGSQIEIMRSRSVLAPVVARTGFQLRLFDNPGERTTLFEGLEVATDAEPGAYLLSTDGTDILVSDDRTEEVLAAAPPGERLEGPGFSFIATRPVRLEKPVQFNVARPQAAVNRLRNRLLIEDGKGPDLVTISFTDPDPVFAALVANEAAFSYQDYSRETNRAGHARRRASIADQVVIRADSLRAAQDASMEYQRTAQLLNPGVEGNALMSNILSTETTLQSMNFDEVLLESMVRGLENSDRSDESLHRIMALGANLVPGGASLDSELRDLSMQRNALIASPFGPTESAPEVLVIDSLIAMTKNSMQIAAEQALSLQKSRISDTEERLGQLKGQLRELPARTAEFVRLEQRVAAIRGSFDALVAQYFQAQIEEGAEAGDVEIVDPAAVPLGPDPSRRSLKLMIALLAGVMVGALGAITLDQLDSRVRGTRDAEQAVHLQVLGTVPKISSRSSNPKSVLIGKEAFRGLRTNIRFALSEQPRLLAITSSAPGEGKSTIAVNLALTLAEQGSRVLLIDADLRRPQVHRILGVDRRPGLSDVLTGQAEPEHAIIPSPVHPGLSVLPGGSATGSPAELVGGDNFMSLVLGLREQFDTVLVDTSPVLAVTDAALIGTVADGTLVVVRANETDQGALSRAVEQLRRVNANLVGIVLNDVPLDNVGYSSYYDSYYDGNEEDSKQRHLLRSGSRGA